MRLYRKKWWLSACLGVGITTMVIAGAAVLQVPRESGFMLYKIEERSIELTFQHVEGQEKEFVTKRYIRSRRPWSLFWKFRGMTSTSEYRVTGIRKGEMYEYHGICSNSAGMSIYGTQSTCFIKI